jgi:hypothetical protein
MSRRRTTHPHATAQERRTAAVDQIDRSYFKSHPSIRTYRRRYHRGEWPGSDYADDGRAFEYVLVSRIGAALHRWFLTEKPAGFSYGFTSAPDDVSMAMVKDLIARFAAQEGIHIGEISEVRV